MIVAGSRIVHPGPVRKTQFGIYLMRTRIHGNCMMISRKRQAFSRCRRMENLPRGFAPREVQSVKELPNRPRFCYNRRNGGCFHGSLEKRRTA